LTKGQVSPTTPIGYKTKTTAYGAYEKPIKPLEVMLAYGCAFVGQGFAADIKHLTELITAAIKYPGFSYVNVISPCVTYRGGREQYDLIKQRVKHIDEIGHDVHDWDAAHALIRQLDTVWLGILWQERRETYQETQEELKSRVDHAEQDAIMEIAARYR